MTSSLNLVARLGTGPLQGAAALIDRGFRLHNIAVRNAARAVASDRVAARLRAEAHASLADAVPTRELSLVGA
jgi:hypothetical protein